MQTVNISLMWWLAHGATVPEAVVVYDYVSPAKNALCRWALGPEVWVSRTDMDTNGSWLGPVNPPLLTSGAAQEVEELPPPPAEIIVPVYADTTPTPCALPESGADVANEVETEATAPEDTKRRGPLATACPPEVEALLGTDKDTLIAAQTGFSVHLVNKWRTERSIPRYLKASPVGGEGVGVTENVTYTPAPVSEIGPTLAAIITQRFSDGASDEDMAQEAGVSVFKVVEVRRKLGLQRPRGRKPGTQHKTAPTSENTETNSENTEVVGVLDSELDALLA